MFYLKMQFRKAILITYLQIVTRKIFDKKLSHFQMKNTKRKLNGKSKVVDVKKQLLAGNRDYIDKHDL